ncbi:MAG: hypothetical protein QGF46_07450 [Planctomycetota bacterium]|nr:hypothetical protein [Planctomycetota bacterium]
MRLLPLKSELERPPTSRGSNLPSLVLGTALGWWTIHNNLSGFHDSANLCLLVLALLVALAAKFKLHGQAFLIGLVLGFGYTQRHQVVWLYLLVALVYLIKFIKQRQADR